MCIYYAHSIYLNPEPDIWADILIEKILFKFIFLYTLK